MTSQPLSIARTFCFMLPMFAGMVSCCQPLPVPQESDKPRLLVVVSIDQFAYEYLDRFSANFSEHGIFRRARETGASFSNCHHRHAFTLTGPGHSVMMTGTYPFATGIIDNNWYDRLTKKQLYCVEDPGQPIVGAPAGKAELKGVSPKNMLVPTVGDVLKKSTGGRSRVFGVTLKDRAAVLMTGHTADLAIWWDVNTGNWVSSRYYCSELPRWLKETNDAAIAKSYAGKTWDLLYDKSKYRLHYPDDASFEGEAEGLGRKFPHSLDTLKNGKETTRFFKQLAITPFGNEMTIQVTEKLIVAEKLGGNSVTDILCLGLSSNDYVGHNYGPHSLEVEDICYRTDVLLGKFADFLDDQVGTGKWTMAITADHGVAPIPEYAATINLPAKRNAFEVAKLQPELEKAIAGKYGAPKTGGYIEKFESQQIFLQLAALGEKAAEIRSFVSEFMKRQAAIEVAFTREELLQSPPKDYTQIDQFRRSFHAERSGDVLFAQKPYQILGKTPATHGSPWAYDSNVPLLFLGCGIKQGRYDRPVSPAHIAPTVSKLLGINLPQDCVEPPLDEVLQTRAP